MDTLVQVVTTAFWGLLLLSALVFLHEGGHFLAARACGVRVTEYFLGLPCRFNLSHTSKRIGTKFGITPILLGGYAMICGMDPTSSPIAPAVLTFVHRRGTATLGDIAQELDCSEDEALEACMQLMEWGSIAPARDTASEGSNLDDSYPSAFAAASRDAAGATIFDGRRFDRAHATREGEPWQPPMDENAFFELEKSRTYIGKGFWPRAFMLVAGILVNLITGLLLLMSIYSLVGVEVTVNENIVGSVEAGSAAEAAGLMPGDEIISIDGVETQTWTDVYNAIQGAAGAGSFEITFIQSDTQHSATVELEAGEMLGIGIPTQVVRLNPVDSARLSISYVVETARSIFDLFNPQHTMEMLENTTSIVGISVMSAQAAAQGPTTFLMLAALISFSLGLMNLLPIPPLDGGKLIIEIIQAVTRREVPLNVQSAISYVGVALFLALFVLVLRNDIIRFIL